MRLVEVTVQNYRSITSQTKFAMDDLTTLVGPNNEGKSNLLRAVAVGMDLIRRWPFMANHVDKDGALSGSPAMNILRPRRTGRGGQLLYGYRWGDDYPLGKQAQRGAKPTVIRLRFRLAPEEVRDFSEATGIANNGDLPIEISLGRLSVSFGVLKPGRGAATHKAKARQIAEFISARVSLVSVPAIRTSDQALGLVNELSRLRMRSLLNSEEYVQLTKRLNELRKEAVEKIGIDLTSSVQRYIPSVRSIELQTADVERTDSVDELSVDDGAITSIESKGDGIKSLVTMALIQELAQEQANGYSVILAVDEPEAHLHPASVHELQQLFQELSMSQQVLLATHNPIFVNRERVSSNILVLGNSARPARNVSVIRGALGIELHDNLASAETVVIVEGLTDERVIPALLSLVDERVASALAAGRIVFRASKGAGKMRAQIQREKATVCRIIAVLDDDAEGREEARRIREVSILPSANVFVVGGRSTQAEIEDLIEPDVYLAALTTKFGRTFTASHFARRSKKWSQNFAAAAVTLGIPASPNLLDEAKVVVADAVQAQGSGAIRSDAVAHLTALAELIAGPKQSV